MTIEQVWLEHHAKLRRFVARRVGDSSMADDIMQEVFLAIHGKLAGLRSGDSIEGWLFRIARNRIVDHYRSRAKDTELPASLAAADNETTEAAREDIMACLLPMIGTLPPHYREAVVMAELEELPHKEVAARQNVSLAAAKSRVRRGKALLKRELARCCRFTFDVRGRAVDYERKRCDLC